MAAVPPPVQLCRLDLEMVAAWLMCQQRCHRISQGSAACSCMGTSLTVTRRNSHEGTVKLPRASITPHTKESRQGLIRWVLKMVYTSFLGLSAL